MSEYMLCGAIIWFIPHPPRQIFGDWPWRSYVVLPLIGRDR